MTNKAKSITAVIVFALTWLNVILNSFGMEAVPVDQAGLYTTVSVLLALGSSAYSIWHNFNFTSSAKIAQDFLTALKAGDLTRLTEVFERAQEFIKQLQALKDTHEDDKTEGGV